VLHPLIIGLGSVVAVGAAVRSTWSPCGLSMLSTITPFGERSRGHRYWATVTWFVLGSILGGATLGAVGAGLAALASAAGLGGHPGVVVGAVAVAAVAAAATDAGLFGDLIPLWRRQVDDGWLSRYRRWAYATGFGWQIGVGVATYIMTTAVFLVVVLAAVTAVPVVAFAMCTGFGLVRGLAVTVTARAESPARLRQLHRRFDRAGPGVRAAVIVMEAAVAVAVLGAQWPVAGAITVVGAAVLVAARRFATTGKVLLRWTRAGPRRVG